MDPRPLPRLMLADSPSCTDESKRSPWLRLLHGCQQQPVVPPPPPLPQTPPPDPATGLINWTSGVATTLHEFWNSERGVTEPTQVRRHVAHAELDPKQRDLGYVRWAMRQWVCWTALQYMPIALM